MHLDLAEGNFFVYFLFVMLFQLDFQFELFNVEHVREALVFSEPSLKLRIFFGSLSLRLG